MSAYLDQQNAARHDFGYVTQDEYNALIRSVDKLTRALQKAEAELAAARALLRDIRDDYRHTVYDDCDGPMITRINDVLAQERGK